MSAPAIPDPSRDAPLVFGRSAVAGLLGLAALITCLRLPAILRQIPSQDEYYFAVPGATILEDGVPRIPYLPSRNPAGAFYRADEMLFTLPPAYFYWQAGWYSLLGPSTASARIAALVAGLIALPLLYWLGLRWTGSPFAAGLAVTLYGLSRVFMFPSVVARPDMLCGCLGIAALSAAERWRSNPRTRWLVGCGALIGAGLLTHPFALVYALQIGLWVCLVPAPFPVRFRRGAILTVTAIVVFSLWGILVLQKPDLFRKQFFNNVVGQAGPGIPSRLVWPWPSIRAQGILFEEHAGLIQAALMGAGLLGLGLVLPGIRRAGSDPLARPVNPDGRSGSSGRDGLLRLWSLALSSVYLLIVCQGHHATKGYWCYPGALMFLCLGAVVGKLLDAGALVPRGSWIRGIAALVLLAAMVPGSGLRATIVYLRHWDDIEYDAPRFTAALIAEVPPQSRLIVDPGYVFDFYRAGRDVRLGMVDPFYYDVRGTPYDFVIGGPYSIRDGVPEAVGAELVKEQGNPNDLFACSAKIYRSGE